MVQHEQDRDSLRQDLSNVMRLPTTVEYVDALSVISTDEELMAKSAQEKTRQQ